jgi:hypothetical protein
MGKLFELCVVSLLMAMGASLGSTPKPALTAAPLPGLLGMDLVDAQRMDFFTWFHLAEIGRERDASNRTVVSFKPTGEAFRQLVTLRTTLDVQGRIVQMDLYLARSFVNDRHKRVFANDIAKSLLLDAPPRPDRAALEVLAEEIASNKGTDTPVLTAQQPAETPLKESPGYQTYLGRRYVYTQEFSRSTLHMENLKHNEQAWLQLQLSLKL